MLSFHIAHTWGRPRHRALSLPLSNPPAAVQPACPQKAASTQNYAQSSTATIQACAPGQQILPKRSLNTESCASRPPTTWGGLDTDF